MARLTFDALGGKQLGSVQVTNPNALKGTRDPGLDLGVGRRRHHVDGFFDFINTVAEDIEIEFYDLSTVVTKT